MNNKKLFKGALVLFASILMAVSCSAGDKTGGTGDDNTNKDDTTTQKKDLVLNVEQVVLEGNTTTAVIKGKFDTTAKVTATGDITLSGEDGSSEKVEVEVGTVKVIASGINNTTIANRGTFTDLTPDKANIEAKGGVTASITDTKLSLTLGDDATKKVFASGGGTLSSANNYGMISVELTFKSKASGFKPKTITVFVGIQLVS